MKILFIVNDFPKLSETFILNQMTGLIDRGNDIKIFAKKPSNDTKVHELVKKYHLLNKVIYYSKYQNNKFFRALYFLHKISLHYFKKIFNKNYKGNVDLRYIVKNHALLYLLLICNNRNYNFDIIIAHFGPNGLLAQILKNMGLIEGKLFTVFHGYDMSITNNNRNIYDILFKSNSILLPISKFWGRKLIKLGANPSDVIVHHMGIDLLTFKFNPTVPSKTRKEFSIISVARFVEKKGLHYGINAVKILTKKGYSVKYRIVGGGPLARKLKEEIEIDHLSDRISLDNWKTQLEVKKLMKDADFVLLPSVRSSDGDMEGIPVTLMEAMAMGKIVISTYHSAIPELIDNGINGILVNERNSEAIANALIQLINSQDNWIDIETRARRKIEEEFNIQKLNDNLSELFTNEININEN